MNEIYSASLLYHLFLSYYILKNVVIMTNNGTSIGKTLSTENPYPRHFYLCGDGDEDEDEDGFEGGDGDGRAIPGPAPLPFLVVKLHCLTHTSCIDV